MTTNVANGNAAPMPIPRKIGSWLCNEGPYQEYVAVLSGSNPGLKKSDPNNKKIPIIDGNAKVILLDAAAHGPTQFTRTEFRSSKDLQNHFSAPSGPHTRRRIYLMEGLAKDFISLMGDYFMMPPTFFQRQERTCVWSNEFTPVSDALPMPSMLEPDKSFHLQYCELRQFSKAIENRFHFCKRTGRHVGMTPPRHKEDSTTGILRRKVSWWCRPTVNDGWEVVILCDPQLNQLSPEPKEFDKWTGLYKPMQNTDDLKNSPFQDGYVDFVRPSPYDVARRKAAHPRNSMLYDLVYYFEHHADMFEDDDWKSPTTSSFFVKKVVTAHYLQLVDYIKAMLPSLELRLTTAWVEEQEQWKSLQTISRRCGNYRDDVEDILLSLGVPFDSPQTAGRANWKDSAQDFQYIYFRLKILKERADTLMQAMTGLASIAGNRQNLEEAKRVKRLNLLALLFIPLAYTSSLFSMQDNYAPGNKQFWVYWVVAVSAVAVTLISTWVLDSALDDAAQWTVPFRKFLQKFGEKKEVYEPKRRTTGFYKLE